MKTKLQQITELSIQTTESLTSNLEQWESFLKCSAWNYKYSFADQILIYAQRPNATACASIDVWNQKLHRWVNRGAKGIALISDKDNSCRLRYVFDISDTDGKAPINLWSINNNENQIVTKNISNIYEADIKKEYLNKLQNIKLSPSLEKALFKSVEYTVLTRCGMNVDNSGLESVLGLKGLQSIVAFGTILNAITKEVLGQIVKEKSIGTIVNQIKEEYNVAINANEKGGNKNERNQIQERGRILSSGFGDTSGQQISWEIRNDEEKLSQRKQSSVIQRIENNREADGALLSSGNVSQRNDGNTDKADGTSQWNNGTIEIRRPDALGGPDEQHQTFSGRSDSERPYIRLIETLPTVVEQQNTIKQAEENNTSSALFISQQDIDHCLRYGLRVLNGKVEVYKQLSKGESSKSNEDFLKYCYGTGGASPVVFNDKIDEWHDKKGIRITKTTDNGEKHSLLLSWKRVIKRIKELIADDKYLTDEEKLEYSNLLAEKDVLNTANSFEAESRGLLETKPATQITNNFSIKDDSLYAEAKSERYKNNIEAIKLLKSLDKEQRMATPDEQAILSKYVGWGGLSECFDDRNNKYTELKTLLTDDEYISARESTLTAFYTPPFIIDAMYKVLKNMGFSNGNVLEPSCGTGNFIGMLPETMKNSKVHGVELDFLTGRIAQQLYQQTTIQVQGFETTNFQDNFFDVAIGNVPFGQFKVADKKYDKQNWFIHDYFFGKTLDKVRPGGVIAFITSKGTLDKENPTVRKYIAQRAELIGAIRLPNNAFKANAGTEVTSDIIFLQKREYIVDVVPDWVYLNKDKNGLTINQYFMDHPNMIIGEMKEVSGPYGPETACIMPEGQNLSESLNNAVNNIHGEITANDVIDVVESENLSVSATPDVRNFSYTVINDTVYFRENSQMLLVEAPETKINRIKGLIVLRECVRSMIELQIDDCPDSVIQEKQIELNSLYNDFTKKYGLISSRANSSAFSDDNSYYLLCSLEIVDENGKLVRKADMFTQRTIKPHKHITSVDTSSEALAVSIAEKAMVDIQYMEKLTGKSTEKIQEELKDVIFQVPDFDKDSEPVFQTSDEYLSGNVREKLKIAREAVKSNTSYATNVTALEKVQPKPLTASEISVRLGATWLPVSDVQEFVYETLSTPYYARLNIQVRFSKITSEWNIEGKSYDYGNIKARNTYGTSRVNAYKIIEETLNLKDVRIFDYETDAGGRKVAILNKKETAIAQSKQEKIKSEFSEWIWKEPARRERLTKLYNDKFNSTRPREYDGSHITFEGINPQITLMKHQVNAIAHIMYGGNTLLAHVVGAGKTFEMVAAAMESKRLGLCNKSLFVVPNHLTEQWATEFLQLYPSANILVATKKDFEPKNRKRFTGRIATGEYDAVIIGHSQFEKIPLSLERQQLALREQLDEIVKGINEIGKSPGTHFSVKQLEKTKKSIKLKLDRLNDQSRKDDVVTFEELGVDRLFIDEAHYYKNLYLYTKMRNIGGVAQTEAQKSSDLFMKCRYLDEITGGRGIVFATGTPISNSMVEMYTLQRYLQFSALKMNGLQHFDAWASTFGETVTSIELAPEGTGYRAKTRFAKFYNIPELMCMFKEVADIQTADMLNLPVPKANYHNVSVKPSDIQKEMVDKLSERAEKVRNSSVDATVDNMLKITNDGRKLALDQRLINNLLPDFENSKLNACVDNVYKILKDNFDTRATQLVFCDLSTPKGDGNFTVYEDMRNKLIEKGIPSDELKFIHEANTEAKKKELFNKVRSGDVRVLFGSTAKMGAGTNVQERLIALHDLDCPWRPSDLEQRSGRIIRQGNKNAEVDIFRYVTEQTFDAYLYQLVEGKQKFISQIMTSKSPVRSAEDIDETSLSYAEIKMLATGNPFIKEKMDLDIQVSRLKLLRQNHYSEKYRLEDQLISFFPKEITCIKEKINGLKQDLIRLKDNTFVENEKMSPITILGKTYYKKADAGQAVLEACKQVTKSENISIGTYRGFETSLTLEGFAGDYIFILKGVISHKVKLGGDSNGNITRIDNALDNIERLIETTQLQLENLENQMKQATIECQVEFPKEKELQEKMERLNELNILLNLDKRDNIVIDDKKEIKSTHENKQQEYER